MKHIYLANSPLVQEVSCTKTSNPSRILRSRRNSYDALNRLSATDSQAGGIQRQWNYSYDRDRTNRTKCQVIRKKCRREVILSGARLTGTSLRSSTDTLLNYHGYGYNLAAQRTNQARTDASTVAYTRGLDLSGTMEGAGGIGGLLARSHGYSSGNWNTNNFYHADGNGNVTFMLGSAQAMVAQYRYDAYGNLLSSAGSLASANVYRFSSKEFHSPSGLYYYGFRFYDPANQRWLNRDPLGAYGDYNLYRFTYNNPVNYVDPNGRFGIQFGNFNLGWGNPNLAFDGGFWMDLSNGAATMIDGLLPGDPLYDLYGNGDIWDDASDASSYSDDYVDALNAAKWAGELVGPFTGTADDLFDDDDQDCPTEVGMAHRQGKSKGTRGVHQAGERPICP